MAKLQIKKKKSGSTRIAYQFYFRSKRQTLTFPSSTSLQDAQIYASLSDRLVNLNETSTPLDKKTLALLEASPQYIRDRFEQIGLIEITKEPTLQELWDDYWESEYYDLKPCTQSSKRASRACFFRFFDGSTRANRLTVRDALAFVQWLDRSVSEATRAGRIRDIRRVFNWGVEMELIEKNPFTKVKRGSFINKSRETYISLAQYASMLEASPDAQTRAALSLYRIGGLRYGEALLAKWGDVDWERGRMLVHSPKTERYKGKESRVIPLFPELRKELETAFSLSFDAESPYIISRNRTTLRKRIDKIVFLAGLTRWERLIQNLRSSRAIDVRREFGSLCETEWIGHSERTAENHYLHVLEEEFDRAAGLFSTPSSNPLSASSQRLQAPLLPPTIPAAVDALPADPTAVGVKKTAVPTAVGVKTTADPTAVGVKKTAVPTAVGVKKTAVPTAEL